MPRGSRPSTAACISLGARNASEIVILTCRMLHCSRAAICSTVTVPATISSSQRRPRAIDATSVARVSARIGGVHPVRDRRRRRPAELARDRGTGEVTLCGELAADSMVDKMRGEGVPPFGRTPRPAWPRLCSDSAGASFAPLPGADFECISARVGAVSLSKIERFRRSQHFQSERSESPFPSSPGMPTPLCTRRLVILFRLQSAPSLCFDATCPCLRVFAHSQRDLSSLASRPPPAFRRPVPAGCMKSSTTAIASWRAWKAVGRACSLAAAMIGPNDFLASPRHWRV